MARSSVQFTVGSLIESACSIHVPALVVNEIADKLPSRQVMSGNYPHLDGLKLADPHYGKPRKVDLLLGADKFPYIIRPGLRLGPDGTPAAQQSIFGWLLTGPTGFTDGNAPIAVTASHTCTEPSISQALQRFWEIEEIPVGFLTPKGQLCEKLYLDTARRREDGRFVVRLPLRSPEPITTRLLLPISDNQKNSDPAMLN
ncbi:hypothetical protein TKK_0015650 [Trichogramma kaykai]|uniref:Peptidase aspartic putative domain-containing protein n=1 Tax=Trichogramma kaykai TaxID=54128 RepID=A0ABD2WAX2_9HYME